MSGFRDRYGYEMSTSSVAAADLYQRGVDSSLASDVGTDELLAEAVAADPGFALARVALARSLQFQGKVAEARAEAATARTLVQGATLREQAHVAALATAIESGGAQALEAVKAHIAEYPRDAYILSQANGVYGLIGFSGSPTRNEEQLALLESVAESYGDDWWFLSALAFAHNELWQHDTARRLVERSLALRGRNGHAAHTLAHVYFETGATADGSTFLDPWLREYDRRAQLYGHLSWHLALFYLAAGKHGDVMRLYEERIKPGVSASQPMGVLADGASLLWRCDLYRDEGRSPRWAEVREVAAKAFPKPGIAFADVHAALAYAAVGDDAAIAALVDGLRERAAAGKLPAGAGVIDIVLGVHAYGQGAYEDTVRLLEPVAGEVIRIGGSHAQREVIEDTLLEAYLKTGRHNHAEALLTERLARRPAPRDYFSLGRAHAARAQHDTAAAHFTAARDGWHSADPGAPELSRIAAHRESVSA